MGFNSGFKGLILPAAVWAWRSTQPLTETSTRNISWGVKAEFWESSTCGTPSDCTWFCFSGIVVGSGTVSRLLLLTVRTSSNACGTAGLNCMKLYTGESYSRLLMYLFCLISESHLNSPVIKTLFFPHLEGNTRYLAELKIGRKIFVASRSKAWICGRLLAY